MKTARNVRLVLVTTPDRKTARALARAALDARLAACANLVPGIESHYRWKGCLEKSSEILVLFKTTRDKISALEKLVLKQHPYDTVEVISLPIDSSTPRYLDWLLASVR